jgi:hypothetical protein
MDASLAQPSSLNGESRLTAMITAYPARAVRINPMEAFNT